MSEGTLGVTSATLTASVDAGTGATTVTFNYGLAAGTLNWSGAVSPNATVAANDTDVTKTVNLTGLTPGTKYYYQWTASGDGDDATDVANFTTECVAAPTVDDTHTSGMEMDLRWNAVVGATSYKVEVATDQFTSGGGSATTVWSEGFTSVNSAPAATGWTFSGVGQYTGDAYIGAASPAVKFDTANDYIISAEFASGGGTLTWMMYLNGTSTSVMTVEESANGSTWGNAQTYSMSEQKQNTYTKTLQNATKYVRWKLTTKGSNVALDDVSLSRTSGGSLVAEGTRTTGGTETGDGTWTVSGSSWKWTWDAEDAGEEAGTYYYRVTAMGGTCEEAAEGDVELEAATPVPEIEVEMTTKAFGSVTVGNTASQTVNIYNYGDADLTVSSITFTGTGAAHFSSSLSGNLVIGAEDGDSVTVTFAPTAAGTFNNVTMHVFSDDPENGEVTVTGLSGTGAAIANPTVTDSPTIGATSVDWGTTRNGYDVMVVRYASSGTVTAPTGGQSYSVGGTIGAGTVVYKGNGNSTTVSDLTAETGYKFVFYSVNNNYYSPGVTKSVTTVAAGCATRWAGGPARGDTTVLDAGSIAQYVTGQKLAYVFYGAINLDTQTDGGWTVKYGLGTTANGTGWTWNTATRDRLNGSDTWFRSVANEVTLNEPGNWYAAFQFKKGDCIYYAHGAWEEQNGGTALNATRYFEVKDTLATWLGNSYVTVGGTWYNGHGGGQTAGAFAGKTFSPNATGKVELGGQVQTFGNDGAQGALATKPRMAWEVRQGGTAVAGMSGNAELPWYDYDNDDNNNNRYGRGAGSWTDRELDFSNLAAGDYQLAVWFYGTMSDGSTKYDDGASSKVEYVATVSVAETLTASPASLTGFAATYPNAGTQAQTKSFTVTGAHLTGNVRVTAPSGYEVSTSETSGFGSSVDLSKDGNNKITGETVYVRLAANASAGAHNGVSVSISVLGGSSTTASVSLSGTVSAGTPVITDSGAGTPGVVGATVGATINALGAVTTVSFEYGKSTAYGTSGTVTGGDVSGHANQVSGGQTARAVSVTLDGLDSGTHYYYRWTANNGNAATPRTGEFWTACPAKPTVVANGEDSQLSLSWDPVTGAAGYVVNVCEVSGGGSGAGGAGMSSRARTGEKDGEGAGVSALAREGARGLSGYTGTGTFGEITSLSDFTAGGYYVLVESVSNHYAAGVLDTDKLTATDVSSCFANGTTLVNPPASVVWLAAEENGKFSLQNVSDEKYATCAASGANMAATYNSTYSWWTPSVSSGTWRFQSSRTDDRALMFTYNDSSQATIWRNYQFNTYEGKVYNHIEGRRSRVFKLGASGGGGGEGGNCPAVDEWVLDATSIVLTAADGVEVDKTYEWSVMSLPDGTADCGNQDEGTVTVTSLDCAPEFTVDEVSGTATVGDATLGTYQLTKVPDTGYPATFEYSVSTVSGSGLTVAGSGTYSIDRDTGAFSFTPTAGGTYKFTVTAANTYGGSSHTGSYTVTVTVTPRKPTIGALTPGEGTLGGTVSGLGSGATVLLRRYTGADAAAAAAAATADTAGTAVGGTTVVSGALAGGTFSDNNSGSWLTGCAAYAYKIRQTENGQTSDWSDVASGSPTVGAMGTVTVTPGTTTLGFSWSAVAGAAGYKVEACLESEEGSGGMPDSYEGEGTFTEITSTDDLEDGFYVIGYSTMALQKWTGDFSPAVADSLDLTDPPPTSVWKIKSVSGETGQYTIQCADGTASSYIQVVGNDTKLRLNTLSATPTANEKWAFTYSSGWMIKEVGNSGRGLSWNANNGNPRFGHYTYGTSGGQTYPTLALYKLTSGGQTCVTETTTGTSLMLTGLESGEEYSWTVTPYGASESCTGTPQTGEESTSGTPAAPTFSPSTGTENATVGTELAVTLPAATGYPKAMTYTLAGPSGLSQTEWDFDDETREFTFTPTAVGDYVFTLTAANTTGSGTYGLTVHVGAGVPEIGAVSAVPSSTSASVSATGVDMKGAASTAITLEYLATTGTGVTPSDPLTAATGVEPASLAAGTTAGSLGATLEGLTTGTWYYYKWTVTSAGGTATAEGWFQTGCIDAPVVTAWHSGYNLQLSWPPVTGAESYKVEVSTDSSFAGSAGEETEVASTGSTLGEGWSYVNGAIAASGDGVNYHKLVSDSKPGVVSKAFSTVGYSRMTLHYSVATFGTWSGEMNTLTVSYSLDDGATWTAMDSAAEASSKSYVSGSMEMDLRALGQTSVRVKWSAESATSGAGLRVKDLSVTGVGSGSTAGTTADPAVTTLENGKLVWRWTAAEDGEYYFQVTARGGGCTPAVSGVGGPVDLSEASVLSIGTPTQTTIPWTLTPQADWAGWVLVWNEDGDFGTPPDGVAPGAAGDSFAGGTILRTGTGGSSADVTGTHTGLHACDYVFYKVFAYAAGYVWDTTLHTEMGRTLDPLPPTGVAATDVGQRSFTVNWTPQANDGAVRYELTVKKGTISTETRTVLDDDFTSGVPEGWTASGYTTAEDSATRLASSKDGAVTSDPLNLTGNDGAAKLTVRAKNYHSDSSTLKVEVQAGSGSWTSAGALSLSGDAADYPVTLTGCNAATKIRLSAKGNARVLLYSVKVEVESSSVDETTVLSAVDVTSGVTAGQGSWLVTGLEDYTEYNFGVRAVGAECDGDWVTGTVTTLGGPMIGTRPTRLSFGVTTPNTAVTRTLVVTNSGHGPLTVTGVTFGGTLLGMSPFVIKENDAVATWPMVLAAETGRTLTVTWTPTTGGTLEGTLTLANDTEGLESLVVPLTGTCRDPMSEPPVVTGYEVRDAEDRENTVWDDHLKKSPAEGHEVTVTVWLYHASGIVTEGASAPTFNIYDAEGTTLKASGSFTSIREVYRNNREEMECEATVSAWTGDATPGEYRLSVTAKSVNGQTITDTATAMPEEGYYELDRFDRRDEEGNPGHGWTIRTLADADEVVALKGGRLVINGSASGQPGVNGRGGVVRDMQGGGYATEWGTAQSQLTWAFNFAGGRQAAWGTFNGGQYAGAFVLGATSANLFGEGTTSAGYAVVMRSGKVQLARMSAGLSGDASLTPLGDGYPVADGRQAIGVKVAFVPASEHEGEGGGTETVPARLMLYVKEWGGRGAEAIAGDSVTGHSVAFETVELSSEADVALLAESLRYVGMAWNHGSAAGGATTYGAFDDVYVPHEEGQGVPMTFDVADEDIEGPVFTDFNARGAFTYDDIPAGGLSITGLVSDASGVYEANNKWTLFSNDTQVATGFFTADPNGNGAATNVGLSASIARSYFTDTGTFTNYVLEVESTDYDTDWEGDALTAGTRYHFTVTDQVLTEPTAVTADADGAEMVVVRWSALQNWVVIMEGTNAIPEDWTPPQGTNLEAGQVLDGPGEAKFRVVYVGNGTWVTVNGDDVCSEATELTVAPGSTNYYRVYGTSMGYYGKGIAPTNYPVKTPKYEKGEIVDSFSYPDKVVPSSVTEDQWKWASDFSLDREATGAGWDGGWWFGDGQSEGLDGHAWKIHDGGLLGGTTEFPAGTANKLFWNDKWADGASKEKKDMWMKRKLASPMSAGKVFVAFQMNYQYEGAGKYILVTLTGGENFDQEIVGFGMTGHDYTGNGKRYASLTIPPSVTGSDEWYRSTVGDSDPRFQFFSNEEMGIGQDYVVVGELDLSEKKVRLWAFAKDQPIPQDYDEAIGSKWVELYCAGLSGKTVTGVKIGMGSPAGQWMGQAYLDELRMGTTWDETLLFNKPEVYQYAYGVTNGVDDQGHTLYKISDGQLAGHDPLDMNFNLYHRSGIQSADVRVLDPFATGETTLAGWQNLHVGSGSHWITTWTPSGVNREHINLESNYTVQVKMTATGGKTNMVTSATEHGGTRATDLFFGEYGENAGFDNYLEIYNGTGQDIDLSNYWIGKVGNPEKPIDWEAYKDWTPSGKTSKQDVRRISGGTILNPERAGDWTLHSPETVCIVSDQENTEMVNALLANGCFVIRLQQAVMAVSGDDPQFLLKGASQAELPEGWLDVTGLSPEEFLGATGGDEEYIMYRLESSEVLPRPYPLVMEPSEWDFRPWPASDRKVNGGTYENMLTTAGVYDSNIGLGGNMEFTVYDDDTEPPTIGSGSKIHLGSEELAAQPGTTETVLAGWTFYEDGNSSKLSTNAWGKSMLTNAAITVGPRYAAWLANQTDKSFLRLSGGTDVNKDFAGLTSLANAGRLVVQPNPDWLTAGTDHTWVRFRFGLVKAEDRMFSFADHAASTNSFSSATLEWSATGRDADDEWTAIASWNPQEEVGTWTLRSFDLSEAASGIPADVATLYLRVNLSGYSGRGSMWSMDNVQLTGYPAELRVSDKELHESGFAFDANVYDESGVDRAGMEVTIGAAKKTPSAWSTGDGVAETSLARATFERVSDKAAVTEWYTQSLSGLLHVGLTAKDLDDDRTVGGANVDQETAEGHFGILQVYDDDEDKPAVEMTGMRAVGGTNMVQWKFVQDGSLMPTAWDDALTVSRLGAKTDSSSEKNMHWLDASGAAGAPSAARGVRQSGWQHGTKFWYFTVTPEEDTQITSLQMFNHINSKYGPTHFTVTVLQGGSEVFGPTAATYFLGSSTATWEDNLGQLNTWIHKSLSMNWTLEKGKTYEFRIQGLGGNKRQGVGAYWGVYDLQLGGGNGETEGMTIKTDADLAAGGSDWLHGSVYDTYSGLDASAEKAPKFTLTGPEGNTLAADQPLTFATALTADGQKKSAAEGVFTGVVPGMGYTDRKLGMYGGWVSAWDADDDRTEDSLESHVGLALTVVDNDVTPPSAPTSVKVNGVAVPGTAPDRYNVTWTNKPEFLVSFAAAEDVAPTAAELASEEWCAAHGVKDAEHQAAVTGIGEYRVALTNTEAAILNAPGFTVAVTNGALANYGFERLNTAAEDRYQAWKLTDKGAIRSAGERAFPNSTTLTPVPYEGTNCLFVPEGTVGGRTGGDPLGAPQSQVIVFTNTARVTPKVGGSFWYYKEKSDSSPRLRISAYPNETMVAAERIGFRVVNPATDETSEGAWHKADIEFEDVGNGDANCILVELYSGSSRSFFDDVRIGVDVGTGNEPTMRYEPDATGQGLALKHLFAVDADNDRTGDRLAGPTATFYTAYDITPPTAVGMPKTGASTERVDDPTTQFDLSWYTDNVGPDDPSHSNWRSTWTSGTADNDRLSPWGSYKIYFGTYNPDAWKTAGSSGTGSAGTSGRRDGAVSYGSLEAYINGEFINNKSYTNWPSVTKDSKIEDPSKPTGANYNNLGNMSTTSIRLYDLDFDQDYVVVIVGVDAAGNEGPATTTSWATNNTIKFAITQGVMRAKADIPAAWTNDLGDAKSAAALYWTASAQTSVTNQDGVTVTNHVVNREYDLIYRDAKSFNESSNNTWSLVGTVQSNWFVDAGALDHDAGRIRFYRAAYKDRWMRTVTNTVAAGTAGAKEGTVVEVIEQRPLMSEDVYAMTAVPLVQGMNYVSLHGFGVGNGETNTLGAIFGTDPAIWPEGTRLDVFAGNGYAAGTIGSNTASRTYVLQANPSGQTDWYREERGNVIELSTHVVNPDIFRHGVAIQLPPITEQMRDTVITNNGKTYNAIYWHPVLLVPTNNSLECVSKSTVNQNNQNQETTGLVPVDFTNQVKAGNGRTGAEWNLCAVNLPVACHPSLLGLEHSGFNPAKSTQQDATCDILYAYDSVAKSIRAGSGMFLGSDGQWRSLANNAVVPSSTRPFYPNDMIVILSRGKKEGEQEEGEQVWTWTYSPTNFYTAPTRWGGW